MKFEIEIEERIIRRNTYTVEVEDEDEGDILLNQIDDEVNDATHSDDITSIISRAGYEIKEISIGAENPEYEVVN